MAPVLSILSLLQLIAFANAQFFIINCGKLTVQRSDPIVNPGTASGHVHAVIGGTAFKQTLSNQDAINAKDTTCIAMDKSNYWIPQLYHENRNGTFTMVPFEGTLVYYLNRACDYVAGKTSCDSSFVARAPPAGLRMLAGDPNLRSYNANDFKQKAVSHVCLNSRHEDSGDSPGLPTRSCNQIRSQIFMPSCWDGKNLDSSDHKSHMAYPQTTGDYNGGVCPQSHPLAIFSIFYEMFFTASRVANDFNRYVYAMGDATGYGMHGDFINGWTNQDALQRSMTTCTGSQGLQDPNCSLKVNGNLGNPGNKNPETAAPNENVGMNGPLSKLPGDNPIRN